MKKNTLRVMVAVVLSVFALAMAGTRPAAACTGGSCGGIGGTLKTSPLSISK